MKRINALFAVALSMSSAAFAARFEAGSGIANDFAAGDGANNVTFIERGNGNAYGWRGWNTVFGFTILPWSLPNEESNVLGARLNLGWGGYATTYGLDAGVFSFTAHDFGGIAANVFGNAAGEKMGGIQIGAVNVVGGSVYGLQVAFVNFAGDLHGVQIGALNFNGSGIACLPVINVGF